MYKYLLCWRYLRTRYIALASIVSVTLGVWTMIVVNSVMSGFAFEMKSRIHGILSDVIVESHNMNGFPDAEYHMEQINRVAGEYIAGMTPTVHVPAMLTFHYGGQMMTRQVTLIAIDPKTAGKASDLPSFLQHPVNRRLPSFELREGGYDTRDHQSGIESGDRDWMADAGWPYRRLRVEREQAFEFTRPQSTRVAPPELSVAEPSSAIEAAETATEAPADPFAVPKSEENVFNPLHEQHTGLILGIALSSVRDQDNKERFLLRPGDDVQLTFPNADSEMPKAVYNQFTIVDFYESKMSEYDSTFVFVPIEKLQTMRGMLDPVTGIRCVNSIQIRLKDERDGNLVRDKLRAAFPTEFYNISTWRDKQGPLLAAVQMETTILNIILFLIIAVAGFGILAIFFMIVVEKTRDIGILKALGASGRGIMGVFLAYGLSLGMVGAGSGLVIGLLFVIYINEIAGLLGRVTGREIFDPSIYYFYKIPTIIDPFTVAWIVCGAMAIAVLASVLPARRASRLHPVEALRYE
ncbi:MAG TPA: ABC transporter permease [Pirellulales bacterium]|nr:ABC transporter permease [Pirellulales bacterium]